MRGPPRHHIPSGFTLLEIMVALAVISIVLMAAMKVSSTVINNTFALRERTLAHWVAMNRAARLELDPAGSAPGSRTGTVVLAGRTWRWRQKTLPTPDPDLSRVEISVGPAGSGKISASLVLYAGAATAPSWQEKP